MQTGPPLAARFVTQDKVCWSHSFRVRLEQFPTRGNGMPWQIPDRHSQFTSLLQYSLVSYLASHFVTQILTRLLQEQVSGNASHAADVTTSAHRTWHFPVAHWQKTPPSALQSCFPVKDEHTGRGIHSDPPLAVKLSTHRVP